MIKTAVSLSLENDTESTSSKEDELEDWIEYIKRSARETDAKLLMTHNSTNWVETQKRLQW